MAKRPGWYADPWGGPHKRWWDGRTWSDVVEGEIQTAGGSVVVHGVSNAERVRPWWQAWWVIVPVLFVAWPLVALLVWPSWLWSALVVPLILVSWMLGLVLVWTRESTPGRLKAGVTLLSITWLLFLFRPLLPFG